MTQENSQCIDTGMGINLMSYEPPRALEPPYSWVLKAKGVFRKALGINCAASAAAAAAKAS